MVNNPNLSVILPVGCNAKCEFCYWEQNKGLTPSIFAHVATTLPKPLFSQVSITGGETTLATDLLDYVNYPQFFELNVYGFFIFILAKLSEND